MSTNKILSVIFCFSCLTACTSANQEKWFVTHTGNMPSEERIAKVENGDSKDEVLSLLGAPSNVPSFDDNTWLYMSSDIKRVAFFKPEEIERNILVINFNKDDKVTKITKLTKADGKNIVPSRAKTEVKGQEQGFFRKYFGGVGQYNPFAGQNRGGL